MPASADAAYPADLLRAVAEAYGLPAPFSTERLTGGFADYQLANLRAYKLLGGEKR